MCCCPYALPVGASHAAAAPREPAVWQPLPPAPTAPTAPAAQGAEPAAAVQVIVEDVGSEDADKENEAPDDETDSEYDSQHDAIIRGKWVYDGCDTIDEMIARLEREAEYLLGLKDEGWQLRSRVVDDYAFLRNPALVQQMRARMQERVRMEARSVGATPV